MTSSACISECLRYHMHSIRRALAFAILAFTLCGVARAQTVPIIPLNPSVLQGATGVTIDTSSLGALRITYAGVSGFMFMDLPRQLIAISCASGGGKCLAPTTVTVRHNISGLRQLSILVDGACAGPTGFGFVSSDNFNCPENDLRLDSQNRFSVRALVTVQKAVGDPTASITVLFNWQVAACLAPASAQNGKSPIAKTTCPVLDPDLAIDHVEVVQGIQEYDPVSRGGKVPLVRGRDSVVRVFVRSVGEGAIDLKGIRGQVVYGFNGPIIKLKQIPRGSLAQVVAPTGTPDVLSRANSLDFLLPASLLPKGDSFLLAVDVWLVDDRGERTITEPGDNNRLNLTVPVNSLSTWPEETFIGVAPVCVTFPLGDNCPSKPKPDDLLSWLPMPTRIGNVFFPKVTIDSEKVLETEAVFDSLMLTLYVEYLKSRQFGPIFALQPPADFLVFNVYGDPHRPSGDTYLAQTKESDPAGFANAWLIRTRDWQRDGGDYQVAHGLGHYAGLIHYDSTDGSSSRKDAPFDVGFPPYGWSNSRPGGLGHEIPEWPVSRPDRTITQTLMDLLGSVGAWVSPAEFIQIFGHGPLRQPTQEPPKATEALVVAGTIAPDGQSGAITTAVHAPTSVPAQSFVPSGDTCLETFGSDPAVMCFNSVVPGLVSGAFARVIPFTPGTTQLKLKYRGKELASIQAGTPPTVAFTSPAAGETWTGRQTIRWTATGNSPSFTVQYSPDDGASWLPVAPATTATQLAIDTNDLVGSDRVRFRILASSGLDTTMAISPAIRVPQAAVLASSTTSVRFQNVAPGDVAYGEVTVTNTGAGKLWAVASAPDNPAFVIDGLSADILGTGESFTLRLRFAPAGPGAQQGTIRIGGQTIALRGSAFASPVPSIAVPQRVEFGTVPALKTTDAVLTIANNGDANLTVTSIAPAGAGYSVVPAMPITIEPGLNANVAVRLAAGSAGPYLGQVIVTSNDPSQPQVVVALSATASAAAFPAASTAGVLNAASFQGGGVAPGEIVTVFGSSLGPASISLLALDDAGRVATNLSGTRVFFDEDAAPIIYTLAGQASVVVPYSVAGKSSTQMSVEYQGRRSTPVTVTVLSAAPGLFSANSSGTGPGAILNQNGSLNTPQNPAPIGSVIVLYGTGEGAVTPRVPDGAINAAFFPKPVLPVKVTVGGVAAKILYAGAAPSLVAGVFQANVEVPAGIASGNQPVVVSVGTASSQANLTVAVSGGTAPALAPVISVSPASLAFGAVTVGQSATRTISIANTGSAALTVSLLSSSNAQFASIDSTPPFTVQSGASQTVTIRFSPTAAGTPSGTITISSNASNLPSATVTVSGTATASGGSGGGTGTNLLCNGSFEQPGTTSGFLTFDPSTSATAFPCWRVVSGNIDYVHRSYWTPSDGDISLDMSGNTAGAIAQTFATAPNTVYTVTFDLAGTPGTPMRQLQVSAAGQSSTRTFDATGKSATNMGWSRETFTFTANAASTTLQFTSLNAGNFGPALDNVCAVAGTGACSAGGGATGGGASAPAISVSPSTLAFGTVTVGQPTNRPIAISNTGNAPLVVSRLDSSNMQFIAIDSPPPFTVQPGASQTVTVRFNPTAPGTFSPTLTISSNDTRTPAFVVNMTGAATAPTGGGGSTSGCRIDITSDKNPSANLTAEGTADWYLMGINSPPTGCQTNGAISGSPVCTPALRKSGGSLLSNLTFFSSVQNQTGFVHLVGDSRTLNWTDGTPTRSGSASSAIAVEHGGFKFTAPADQQQRTVMLHVGGIPRDPSANWTLTAHIDGLTDQTVTQAIDPSGASNDLNYKILYQAPQQGQITVSLQVNHAFDEVLFQAVALSLPVQGSSCGGSGGGGGGTTGTPSIDVTPATTSYGSVTTGQSATRPVTIRNAGTAPLTVTFVSSTNALFAPIDSFPPFTLQPSEARAMTFRFSPTAAGTFTSTVTISSHDPARPSVSVTLTGAGVAPAPVGTGNKLPISAITGVPNRTADNVPANAIDGNTSTFTWTTPSGNVTQPSYLEAGLASIATVSRIRLFKDNDSGGGGPLAKNLTIDYTATDASVPLANRTWIPVTGLANGFNGTELMTATALANGAVIGDNHNSLVSGWASLTFAPVNATGIRIGFSNPAGSNYPNVHYRVYELELYGAGGSSPASSTITFGQTVNGALSTTTRGRASDCTTCYADFYQLTVTASRSISIRLNSVAFDAYLNLLDAAGNIIAADDDSGGGLNALLTGTLSAGVYRIEVTTANSGETGPYTLTISP